MPVHPPVQVRRVFFFFFFFLQHVRAALLNRLFVLPPALSLFLLSSALLSWYRHAQAMLKMISLVVGASGGQLEYYMLIFLKFIQSIIPNIEYDYTGEFRIVHK